MEYNYSCVVESDPSAAGAEDFVFVTFGAFGVFDFTVDFDAALVTFLAVSPTFAAFATVLRLAKGLSLAVVLGLRAVLTGVFSTATSAVVALAFGPRLAAGLSLDALLALGPRLAGVFSTALAEAVALAFGPLLAGVFSTALSVVVALAFETRLEVVLTSPDSALLFFWLRFEVDLLAKEEPINFPSTPLRT